MLYNESKGGWLATVSQYAAWLVTSIIAIIDMLAIREAVLALLAWFRVVETAAYHQAGGVGEDIFTGFGISAADNVLLLILGCAVVAVVILVENYFRKGRPLGLLYKRIGKVFLIEIAIILGAILIRQGVSMILAARPA